MTSGQSAFPAPARPGLGSSERLVAYPDITPTFEFCPCRRSFGNLAKKIESHFLGRALREQGHEGRLIAAQYVKPYGLCKEPPSSHLD